jgi:hypothetical protein
MVLVAVAAFRADDRRSIPAALAAVIWPVLRELLRQNPRFVARRPRGTFFPHVGAACPPAPVPGVAGAVTPGIGHYPAIGFSAHTFCRIAAGA